MLGLDSALVEDEDTNEMGELTMSSLTNSVLVLLCWGSLGCVV